MTQSNTFNFSSESTESNHTDIESSDEDLLATDLDGSSVRFKNQQYLVFTIVDNQIFLQQCLTPKFEFPQMMKTNSYCDKIDRLPTRRDIRAIYCTFSY